MQYAKYFVWSAALPVLLIALLGWYIEPLSGDLTRLGKLAERDFGWRAPQPVLPEMQAPARIAAVAAAPAVAVLGDSFSERNIWQTVAAREARLSIVSFHWRDVDTHACLEGWLNAVRVAQPTVRFVVLQSIERLFVARFGLVDSPCTKDVGLLGEPMRELLPLPQERRTLPGFELPDTIYAIRAGWNGLRNPDGLTRRSGAYLVPLVRGDLFTNRRADLLLFYKDDLDKKAWRQADLQRAGARLKALQAHAQTLGLTLTVALVPDKSSAYAQHLKFPVFDEVPPDPWQAMRDMGVAQIDLQQALVPATAHIADLYLPNDTHVGMQGYTIIGLEVARWLLARQDAREDGF